MRPQVVTVSSADISAPLIMNWRQQDFKVSVAVAAGSGTYSVQHTLDDPADFAGAAAYETGATWFDHEELVAQTADGDGNYAYPVRALRLNVTAYTSGDFVMTVLQAK